LSNKQNYFESVTNMGEMIMKHEIIICNGGTTLLEAIYLNKIIIPIPQSDLEEKFIKSINYKFYTVNDMEFLIKKNDVFIPKEVLVDNKGKERIKDIIINEYNKIVSNIQ
ncbi:MAG: hypothetical protein SNJ71_04440, partial [Bacteroidales bacterium]